MKPIRQMLFLLLITFCSKVSAQVLYHIPMEGKSSKAENLAVAKIFALPEVKEFFRHAKASKPALMTARTPHAGFKYYWIKMGISNLEMFRTTENFYVDAKTLKIYYMDLFSEPPMHLITLKQWRHFRHSSIFQRSHTYKRGKLVALAIP